MNDINLPPDDPRLSARLREARLAPELPPRFQQTVWRRIEAAEAPVPAGSWLDALSSLILRPRLALALAAAILIAGTSAGMWQGRQIARHHAQANYLTAVAPAAVR